MRKTDDPATPSPMMCYNQRRSRNTSSRKWIEYGLVFMVHQIQAMSSDDGSFNSFTPTTVEKTEHLIVAVPNKHCLLDPVPTALIKNCATLMAPFLSLLFKKSQSGGYIPASQKVAIVKSLLKKED